MHYTMEWREYFISWTIGPVMSAKLFHFIFVYCNGVHVVRHLLLMCWVVQMLPNIHQPLLHKLSVCGLVGAHRTKHVLRSISGQNVAKVVILLILRVCAGELGLRPTLSNAVPINLELD